MGKNLLPKTAFKKKPRVLKTAGEAPGTVTYLGNKENVKSTVHIFEYDDSNYKELSDNEVHDITIHKNSSLVSWINVIGINEEKYIEDLGKMFGLNNLILADAVNTHQRPKIDEYENHIFGVFKMLYLNEQEKLVSEHVALVLLENTLLVLQELEDDVFGGVRDRIKKKSGRVRAKGADYLFALLDTIIDNYYIVLDNINHKIELLEEEVYSNPKPEVAQKIQALKKEVLEVRKWIFPVKELVSRLINSESPLIKKDTKLFLRDALDHSIEINESLQIYREMSMSLMEMYMTNISNKMNEVMKVLTIMSSIFIPLTFITGVYGMNFENMPGLHIKYGYYYVCGLMIALFIGMLLYFKRKDWL